MNRPMLPAPRMEMVGASGASGESRVSGEGRDFEMVEGEIMG